MDAKVRQLVRTRAGQLCEYCRLPQEFSELRFHVEHILARQHGGGWIGDPFITGFWIHTSLADLSLLQKVQ